MTTIFTATAANSFYFIDLCVVANDEADARQKFESFIASLEYSEEEAAGGEYEITRFEEDGWLKGWLGEPSTDVQIFKSGSNG
jgi:hypothetical protein